MLRKVLFLCGISMIFYSCKNNDSTSLLQDQLEQKISELETQLKDSNIVEDGKLAHVVFLNLKENITETERNDLVIAIEDLKNISVVEELHLGSIANTGDARFISDDELMFQITVNKIQDLDVYQKDSIHLKLKKMAKDFLSNPPAVYDYWVF